MDHNTPIVAPKPLDASRELFRHNLARIMAEKAVTQAGLARLMNVSRVAVHAWIWGTCFPETARLMRLAQALNVNVGQLLNQADVAELEGPTNEEVLLLDAFRRLPSHARLSLLADAYGMSITHSPVSHTPVSHTQGSHILVSADKRTAPAETAHAAQNSSGPS